VTAKTGLASLVMGAAIAAALPHLESLLGSYGTLGVLALVVACGAGGLAVYLGMAALLRVEEIALLYRTVQTRLRRGRE